MSTDREREALARLIAKQLGHAHDTDPDGECWFNERLLAKAILADGWSPPAPTAQCCMCGKKGLSTAEDGGPECELSDGRWVCGPECYDRAVPPPTATPGAVPTAEQIEKGARTLSAHLDMSDGQLRSIARAVLLDAGFPTATPEPASGARQDDLVERVARAWASIDGRAWQFDVGKASDDLEAGGGHYAGYMAEAEELIRRAGLASFWRCISADQHIRYIEMVRAALDAALKPWEGKPVNYHARIMNMGYTAHLDADQKLVERDTRHAAAEIANEADAEVASLTEALAFRDELIAELREALELFARADRAVGDALGPFRFETGTGHRLIERGDLRRARAALAAPDTGGADGA